MAIPRYTKSLHTSVEPAMHDDLSRIASDRGVRVSDMVRHYIEIGLATEGVGGQNDVIKTSRRAGWSHAIGGPDHE